MPQVFKRELDECGLDIRPSIAVTRAHMKLSEVDESARRGELAVDGLILINLKSDHPLHSTDGSLSAANPGVKIVIVVYVVMNISITYWAVFYVQTR